jgi:hypothetical protein
MADKDFKVKTGLDLPAPLPLAEGGTGQTSAENTINALMPVQTGHSGKFITTDGTGMSWAVAPQQTATDGAAGYKVYAGNTAPTGQSTGDIWIDGSTGNGIQLVRWRKTIASLGSTITGLDDNNLTLSYTAGNEQVYINGTLITRGQDYTATNGTSIVLTQSAEVGDTVEIFGNPLFSVTDVYTQAQSNSLYILKSSNDIVNPNHVINGGFDYWQRGTTFSLTTTGYTADRFNLSSTSSSSASRSTDVPTNNYSRYSLSATSDQWANGIYTLIENGALLVNGRTYTFSAWVKGPSGKTANISIGWQTEGSSYTFTGSWQYITRTVTFGNTFRSTNGGGDTLYLHFVRNVAGGASQLVSGDTVLITQCKMEEASQATPFTRAGYTLSGELAACQRYYYTLPYNYNAERANPYTDFLIMNTADQTSWARAVVQFPVTMRTSPTLQAPTAGNYYILGSAGVLSVTSISIDNMTNASMAVVNAYRTGMSTGTTYFLRFAGNVTDYLRFSAEL